MNGFRITVLTLLCLSVGLMFYAVVFVVPGMQSQQREYQASQRIAAYDIKNDIHRRQMNVYDPMRESPEIAQARRLQETAERRQAAELTEAEENNVIAAAKHKEELARSQAEKESVVTATRRGSAIGKVASYNAEWECILIIPAVPQAFPKGALLAVWRGDKIVCEATVDNVDAESGQVSATCKESSGSTSAPAPGDTVTASPYSSVQDLKNIPAEVPPGGNDPENIPPPLEHPAQPSEPGNELPNLPQE